MSLVLANGPVSLDYEPSRVASSLMLGTVKEKNGMTVRILFPALASVFLMGPRLQAQAWHLPDWPARAVVEIPQPLADAAVDTAAARILTSGKPLADGRDFRVLDEAGKPVLFQL